MSTTSTTFDKRKKTRRKLDNLKTKQKDSLVLYEKDQSDTLSEKWSNNRVLGELSTFIAEYSYNNDTQNSKPNTPKSCDSETCGSKPYYSVYNAHTSGSNGGFFRRKKKRGSHFSTHRKGSVEWLDSHDHLAHNKKRNYKNKKRYDSSAHRRSSHSQNHNRKFDSQGETSDRESSRTRKSRSKKRIKGPKHISVRKSRTKSKASPCRERPSRSQSECQETVEKSRSPWVRRRRVSKPRLLKHIPIKHEGKKTIKEACFPERNISNGEVFVKERRTNLRKPYVQVKKPILNDNPTIITLFPKNSTCDAEVDFLKNPDIRCKCFRCKKKYESLVKLSECDSGVQSHTVSLRSPKNSKKCPLPVKKVRIKDSENVFYEFLPDEPMACQPFTAGCQANCENCEPDCPCSAQRHLFSVRCNSPCYESKFISEWNFDSCDETNGGKCYKSVYFKLNCICHPVDSAVTKFFQSILRKSMCT